MKSFEAIISAPYRLLLCLLAAVEGAVCAAYLCWKDPVSWRNKLLREDSKD